MDYSLLVGVDTLRHELACGIIDYLRQYTWDKQLENWVKSSLVVPKNQLPTIISPRDYKKRFRTFINTHFLSVPDHWCSQTSFKRCAPPFQTTSLHKKSQKRGNQDDDDSSRTSQKQRETWASYLKVLQRAGIVLYNWMMCIVVQIFLQLVEGHFCLLHVRIYIFFCM